MDSRVQHKHDTSSFFRLVLVVVAGMSVLATLAVGVVAVRPIECGRCHDQARFVKATQSASHSGIPCRSCHVPATASGRTTFAFRQLFGMAVPLVPVGDRIVSAVPDSRCLGCHKKVMDSTSASRGYRIAHKFCAAEAVCSDCHSSVAHGSQTSWTRTAQMETCVRCHQERSATLSCSACHDEKQESERIGASAWRITHGPDWRKTHGAGDTDTCTMCHERDKCAACHLIPLPHPRDFVSEHAGLAADPKIRSKSCSVCHKQSFCDDCHGVTMPHTKAFTERHPKLVGREGDKRCMKCHTREDCETCHYKHVHPVTLDQLRSMQSSGGGDRE